MPTKHKASEKGRPAAPKTVLKLPDLDQAKSAVLNSLSSKDAQRGYMQAIDEFVDWYARSRDCRSRETFCCSQSRLTEPALRIASHAGNVWEACSATMPARREYFDLTTTGRPGLPAPTRCPESLREATETQSGRSTPLGLVVRDLDRLAIGACHCQTADRCRLAPEELPSVLDVEDPAW